MSFNEFINNLNAEEKNNYNDYSEIRGVQQYKIIYESLYNIHSNVTYNDVNAFIRMDKNIKDILFTFLGTLEEYIRNDILLRFDFDNISNSSKDEYHYFSELPPCIKKNNNSDEITEFYKRFNLNFGDLILFIKKYDDSDKYDISKLKLIKELRNAVMHHMPLLFNYNYESTAANTLDKINVLKELLPKRYQNQLIRKLKYSNNKTKENISIYYYECLLYRKD